jgi:hypothetical protein
MYERSHERSYDLTRDLTRDLMRDLTILQEILRSYKRSYDLARNFTILREIGIKERSYELILIFQTCVEKLSPGGLGIHDPDF